MNMNNKISLIIDVDQFFNLYDIEVESMINGDIYKVDELYIKSLEIFKNNYWIKFKHIMSGEIKTLVEWMIFYQCDINDPASIIIFLRVAVTMLI